MKQSLAFYKPVIIVLAVTITAISSCSKWFSSNENINNQSLLNSAKIIKIVGIDSNGDLNLRDLTDSSAKLFSVQPSENVMWLQIAAGVSTIDNIYKKPTTTSDTLFQTGPSRMGGSQNWKTTINPSATSGQFEDYNIDWTDTAGHHHTFDPRIQIKP